MKKNKIEILFWSIALPGFGQILNGQIIKGILFIGLEILVNFQANFNQVILLSFNGKILEAIHQTDYGWLMFYPCVYFFAMWDAYKNAEGITPPYSFFPFVLAAYFGTVGIIYSSSLTIFGVLFGPLWLSMLFFIIGIGIGLLVKRILIIKSSVIDQS
ncbi:hypothetical protein [Paenisporosarcina sp. TG20]|uniref:hypothetical protein n=1 Tax=Paenisporosarcina sp. TG20 TaxID=1211706 RepID=UPI000306B3EA|nr:hypothetical protein [Paenisporosarcina sp. TG20]